MGKRKHLPPIGDPNDPRGFEVLIRRYEEWCAVHQRSQETLRAAGAGLRRFGRWCVERGIAQPAEVGREVAERFQRWLFYTRSQNGNPLGFSTQVTRLNQVKSFFRWLTRERYLLYNPTSELTMPRRPPRLPVEGFTLPEVEKILAVPKITKPLGLRDRAILEVLYATGIRRTETVNLDLYDVDFDRGYLVVRAGKGGRDRVVPLGERATAWVRRYVEDVRPELVSGPEERALFVSVRGGRLERRGFTLHIKELIDAASVRPRRGACHLFRHTMATLMLEGGADIRYVQEMLGHVKLETTAIYTHVSIDRLAQVHLATHPGARLQSSDGAHAATREELLAELAAEAAEEEAELAAAGEG